MEKQFTFQLETLSPVDRLLVECIRMDLNQGSDTRALESACRDVKDWETLAHRADYEGVLGWAHQALSCLEDRQVPSAVMDQLRNARIIHTTRSASASFDVSRLLKALSAAGVEHMLLKGPFLAEQVYGRSDLRYYTDIDLMIREKDLDAADDVLSSLGYKQLDDSDTQSRMDSGNTQVHYYREGTLPVDLHWELINLPSHEASIKVDGDEIWRTAVPVVIAGAKTLALSPEDTLMFQCAHMTAHHDFNRLLWFKDVEQVIRRYGPEMDWDLFVEKTSRYGLKIFVYYSILFAEEACGNVNVPGWVMKELRPRYLLARVFERLLRRTNILEMQQNRRRPALEIWLVMRDSGAKTTEAVIQRLFPAVDWYLTCYPFLPRIKRRRLYYLAYPALLMLRVIKRPIRLDLS